MFPNGKVKMAWAVDRDGIIRHVDEVETGKACACVCLECDAVVYAKNRGNRAHHFAHAAETNCSGEGVLHRVAKQLVAHIARVEGLILPETCGSTYREDWRGDSTFIEWKLPSRTFTAVEAELESQRWRDVIPDILLTDASGSLLAVEIAVTHFKGEVEAEFYRRTKVDAVEVDLSDISWQSSRKDLIDRLKGRFPYRWIFQSEADAEAKKLLCEAEEKDVLARIQSVQKLPELASWLFCRDDLAEINAVVPVVEGSVSDIGPGGVSIKETYTAKLEIREVLDQWSTIGSRWINRILVGRSSRPVRLYIQPFWVRDREFPCSASEEPLLVISVPDGGPRVYSVLAEWHGVDRWHERARAMAKKKVEARVNQLQSKQRKLNGYQERFSKADDSERIRLLESKLGHSFIYSLGSYHDAWNACEAIWKGLLWAYCIKPTAERCKSVNVEGMASNEWVCGMLGIEADGASMLARRKMIQDWMRYLERQGYASRGLGGWYELKADMGQRIPGLTELASGGF